MATLKVIAGGKGRETKAMRAKQPFSNREAKQLLKDWKELHRPPIRRTKAWHAKKALLLPKMRAQLEWENYYLSAHFAWMDAKPPEKLS